MSVTYPDSSLNITYTYDQGVNGNGRLTGITDESGSTGYSYDDRGNLVGVTQTIDGQTYIQNYSYSGADRPAGMTLPSGRTIAYSYDTSGWVNDVASNGGEALASNITRLPFGPLQSMTLGNGIDRSRSYDLDYRIQSIDDTGILSRNYAVNAVDNITAITDGIDPTVSQLFTYDTLDRLDFATGNYGDKTYSYDGVGNRQSLATDLSEQGGGSSTQNYIDSCVVESETSTPPPNNATNLLANGGFESWITNWFSCSDAGCTSTSSDATEGSTSLSVSGGDCMYQEFAIAAGTVYDVSCQGKTTQYGSVALTFMDSGYSTLISDSVGVSAAGFAEAALSDTAPANSAIGAITLYGEGTSLFDACSVTEGQ